MRSKSARSMCDDCPATLRGGTSLQSRALSDRAVAHVETPALRRSEQSLAGRAPPPVIPSVMPNDRDTLYYDGQCGMCRRSIRIIRALDWLHRLAYADSTTLPDDVLPVSRDTSLIGIPMRTRGGRTLLGFPAVRRALAQTPVGVVPGLLLYVPGINHLGHLMYRRVATRRSRDAECRVGHAGNSV